MMADEYSSSSTYSVGDYCIYNGDLYKCITAITTAEAWTSGHWTQVQVTNEIGDLKSAITTLESIDSQNLTAYKNEGKYINASGELNTLSAFSVYYLIPIDLKLDYYVSADFLGLQSNSLHYILYYDANKTVCGSEYEGIGNVHTIVNYHKLTIPSDAKYITIQNINTAFDSIVLYTHINKDKYIANITCDISMFSNMAFCGDSYTDGAIYVGDTYVGAIREASWASIMSRKNGITPYLYSRGGASTLSYLTDSGCLETLLSDPARQCYMIALGINDAYLQRNLGTIADIKSDWTQNPHTFYGDYGQIVSRIIDHAPNACIVLIKPLIPTYIFDGTVNCYDYCSSAIEEIAEHFSIPYIDTMDSQFLKSSVYNENINHNHPTAPLYAGIAKAINELMEYCIADNITYFESYYPH